MTVETRKAPERATPTPVQARIRAFLHPNHTTERPTVLDLLAPDIALIGLFVVVAGALLGTGYELGRQILPCVLSGSGVQL